MITASSLFLWEYGLEDIADILLEAGLHGVEFWLETPCYWRKRERGKPELRDFLSNFRTATFHAPILDLNPSSYNKRVRRAALEETLWSLEVAAEMGVEIVTIHPGRRTVKRRPLLEDWERFREYLAESLEVAESLGVTLALENPLPRIQAMCARPGEMEETLKRFPGLAFTFDLAHALSIPGLTQEFLDRLTPINFHVSCIYQGKPHYPLHMLSHPARENVEAVKSILKRYKIKTRGNLTIEINDAVLPVRPDREEKIGLLQEEKCYLESLL